MVKVFEFTRETMEEDLEKQEVALTPELESRIIDQIEFLGCINNEDSFVVGSLGSLLLKEQYGIDTWETKLG